MPCHSDPQDEADARLVADHFGMPTIRVDLAPAYDRLVADARDARSRACRPGDAAGARRRESTSRARVPLANVKPRLRMTALYFVANSLELPGRRHRQPQRADDRLLHQVRRRRRRRAADRTRCSRAKSARSREELGVPDAILDKPPSAGLWPGQTDEAEMGFTYAELERYLADGPDGVPPALALPHRADDATRRAQARAAAGLRARVGLRREAAGTRELGESEGLANDCPVLQTLQLIPLAARGCVSACPDPDVEVGGRGNLRLEQHRRLAGQAARAAATDSRTIGSLRRLVVLELRRQPAQLQRADRVDRRTTAATDPRWRGASPTACSARLERRADETVRELDPLVDA